MSSLQLLTPTCYSPRLCMLLTSSPWDREQSSCMINLQSGNHSILPFGASNFLVCVHHSKVVSTSNFSKLLCRRSVKASRGTGHVALVNTIAVRFGSITSASFGRSSSDLNHNLPRETFKLHVSELIPIVNKPQARRLAK